MTIFGMWDTYFTKTSLLGLQQMWLQQNTNIIVH